MARRMRFITWCKKDPEDETFIKYTFKEKDDDGNVIEKYFTSEDTCSFSFMERLRNAWVESIILVENSVEKYWNAILYED